MGLAIMFALTCIARAIAGFVAWYFFNNYVEVMVWRLAHNYSRVGGTTMKCTAAIALDFTDPQQAHNWSRAHGIKKGDLKDFQGAQGTAISKARRTRPGNKGHPLDLLLLHG